MFIFSAIGIVLALLLNYEKKRVLFFQMLSIEVCDDPFEVKIGLNYEVSDVLFVSLVEKS